MVFSSPIFLFGFLPLVALGYVMSGQALRNLFLLLASLFFYAWGETTYVLVMVVSIVFNHLLGRHVDPRTRRPGQFLSAELALTLGICGNLALLVYFKYVHFLTGSLNEALAALGLTAVANPPIHLPIGISFFTFQAISYLVDLYRKEASSTGNIIHTALYISLFPQLIAGPIVRYRDVAQQIAKRRVTAELFSLGIQRFIFGLAKKCLLANPLGEVADQVFAVAPTELSGGTAWLGILCYSLQIYFDFSGYSDMAIGLGRMFGFRFLENFNYPYVAQSVQEFWRRWHISLSTWFRDYLYIPLGGNRVSPVRTYANLWIVFLLCGLWHGASWNFIIWGALHGTYLIAERLGMSRVLTHSWRPIRHAITLFLVTVAWVFFRADTLPHSLDFLLAMFALGSSSATANDALHYCDSHTIAVLLVGLIAATSLFRRMADRIETRWQGSESDGMRVGTSIGYHFLLVGLLGSSLCSLAANTYNPFIYYRF